MTILYRKIDVPNLDTLQNKLMSVFPHELYRNPRIFFPPDQSKFFDIPELTNILDSHQLKHNITTFGFYVMPPNSTGAVHIDWGHSDYSMNIPLRFCDNTFTRFYSTVGEPTLIPESITKDGIKVTPHYLFNNVKLNEVEMFESNVPVVMHIKTIHNVHNPNNNFRVNLLIRHSNNDAMAELLYGTPPRSRTES